VYNYLRVVRDISETDTDLTFPIVETNTSVCYNDMREMPCPSSGMNFWGQDGSYPAVQYSVSTGDSDSTSIVNKTTFWIVIILMIILLGLCIFCLARMFGKRQKKQSAIAELQLSTSKATPTTQSN
jgi:preprotein translocase subunit SecG